MRWSRFTQKLDTSPLASVDGTTGDNGDESGLNGAGTPKKTPKKSPAKSTPKKRKINEDGDNDEEKVKKGDE